MQLFLWPSPRRARRVNLVPRDPGRWPEVFAREAGVGPFGDRPDPASAQALSGGHPRRGLEHPVEKRREQPQQACRTACGLKRSIGDKICHPSPLPHPKPDGGLGRSGLVDCRKQIGLVPVDQRRPGFFTPKSRLDFDPDGLMCPLEVTAFDFRLRARTGMRMPGYIGST